MTSKLLKTKCPCGNRIPKDSEIYFKTKRLCSDKCFWKAKNKTEKEWTNKIYHKVRTGGARLLNKNGELKKFIQVRYE